MRSKPIWVITCAVLLLVVLSASFHTRNNLSESRYMTNELDIPIGNVIVDLYPYSLYIPYAILQINCVTDETARLEDQYDRSSRDYNKITCEIIYSYSTNRYDRYNKKFSSIDNIYIVSETAKTFAPGDMIFINVEEQFLDGIYYYTPVTINGQTEYVSILDDQIIFNGNECNTTSFRPLIDGWNQIIYGTKEMNERGIETSYPIDALPKKEFQNGMSVDDLIDYLSAWENIKKFDDNKNQCLP